MDYTLSMFFATNGKFGWDINFIVDNGGVFTEYKEIYTFHKFSNDKNEIKTYAHKLIDLLITNIRGDKDVCDEVIDYLSHLKNIVSADDSGVCCSIGTINNNYYEVHLRYSEATTITSDFINDVTNTERGIEKE